ncbi:HK97 family phage prohead protease [uncultured Methylobacterium sp.]|jgi:hypothetical protein|uniref:HK97 family phage prohead protease n=1 Tax=uncultured Methylobacterium sp. TaxID=157278 RepID=UPI0026067876|nr:HK97 family phage prohead protease [uncultured Methylobacterium sp.]
MSAPRMPEALPMQTRLAPLGTPNVDTRTVDVVWTTGATVRRHRWIGYDTRIPFDEELVVSAEAINLDRMRAGAPVLDSHSAWSTDAIRAVVDKVWLSGAEGLATFRFPEPGTRKTSDELFELVRQGIVRNVSVGYAIDRVRVIAPKKEGEIERRIIERWTPFEVSFVTIPADARAQVRADELRSFPVEIVGRGLPHTLAARTRMDLRARGLGLSV